MEPLYLLLHNPPETGRAKVIGVYSSTAAAEEALERSRVLPGFADEPQGFTIETIEIDKDYWSRGFVRLGLWHRTGRQQCLGVL